MSARTQCQCQNCLLGTILRSFITSVANEGPACTNTSQNNTGGSNTDGIVLNSLTRFLRPAPVSTTPTLVPIRVRLAIVRSHSQVPPPPADGYASFDASPVLHKLETYFPPLASPDGIITSAADAIISDFTQYIAEGLFLNNEEEHFLDHKPPKFLKTLLGSLQEKGSPPEVVFSYGVKKDRMIVHDTSKQAARSKSTCIINFSLMEETEGMPIQISPSVNADRMLRKLYSQCSNTKKKLDLILKAHVMSRRPPQQQQQQPQKQKQQINKFVPIPRPAKRKKVCDEIEVAEGSPKKTKQKKTEQSKEATAVPASKDPVPVSKYPNGIPPALSKAWENQKMRASLTESDKEAKSGGTSRVDVEEVPATAEDGDEKMDVHSGDEDSKDTGNGKMDVDSAEEENASIQPSTQDTVPSTKVDSKEHVPADGGTPLSPSSDISNKNKKGETEIKSKESLAEWNRITKSDGKSDPSPIRNGGDELEKDEGRAVQVQLVDWDGDNGATTNDNNVAPKKIDESTNRRESEKESSSEDSDDGSSSDSSSGSSSKDSDDDEGKSEPLLSQDTEGAPPEPPEEKTDTSASDEKETKDDDVIVEEPEAVEEPAPTPPELGKKTPYDITAASNDPNFTQDSIVVPTVLFEEMRNGNDSNHHRRGSEIEASTSFAKKAKSQESEDESSSSSGSSPSSSGSSSSDSDESDEESGDEKEAAATIIEHKMSGDEEDKNSEPQLYPLGQPEEDNESQNDSEDEEEKAEPATTTHEKGDEDGSSSSSSSSSEEEEDNDSQNNRNDEEEKVEPTTATHEEGEKDGSSSSSSSSSGSSTSGSSSDSDSSSSSSDEEKDTKEVQQESQASKSILPVVRSSRAYGRRRTPLVSRNRKIVINVSTGKPKTEKFAR